MVSLRWLSLGRSLAAFAATPLLLLSTFARNASAVYDVPDLIKLAELREYVQQPRFHGVDDPADLFPEWYIAWRIMLQNQTDRLFLALEKRAAAQKSREESGDGVSFEIGTNVDRGFKIHVVGDSTMRMQANVWSWVLSQRKTADGRMQCISHAESDDANEVDMSCTGAERGVNKYGNPPKGEQFVFNLQYTKEFESCVTRSVDADFVYFGCGLHFLQIDPDRRVSSGHLDIWVHYERLLEEAVTFYRSGGGGNRIPMGEAFMTTHSFAADRVDGEYAIRMREYEDRYEPRLATCREIANKQTLLHVDWPNEFEPEEICTLGIFSQSGVANLNERAEKVMDRLGVPMVQGFDITGGQSWATPLRDGRHYPALIPMEISALLSEITTSLRRERREAAE